jgi:hypothetical protein
VENPCRIRTNPSSYFWLIVTVSEVDETDLFVYSFASVSPRIAGRGIRDSLSSPIDDLFKEKLQSSQVS